MSTIGRTSSMRSHPTPSRAGTHSSQHSAPEPREVSPCPRRSSFTQNDRHSPEDDSDDSVSSMHEGSVLETSPANPKDSIPSQPQKHKTTQHLKKEKIKKWFHLYDRLVSDYWIVEAIGVFICVATLISIIGILLAFQDGPTPHVMKGVSLNTAISILATVSRASVVFVVASVIAQQKWLRFEKKPSPLNDVLLYDDASRGPLGSLFLLGSFHLGYVTVMATGVAILALGFEPFVQQSVRYPLKDLAVSSRSPRLPIVKNVTLENQASSNRSMLANEVVLQALYADSVGLSEPTCAGTSCNWPPYTSVAFCSSCEDALDDVVIQPKYDVALKAYTASDYLSSFQPNDLDLGSDTFSGGTLLKTQNTSYTISLGVGSPTSFTLNASAIVDIGLSYNYSDLYYLDTIVWNLNDHSSDCYQDYDPEHGFDGCFKWNNDTVNGIKGPLKAFGYVNLKPAADGLRLVAAKAKRCVLTMCAHQYLSEVHNGSLSSDITATDFGLYQIEKATPESDDLQWYATMNNTSFHAGIADSDDYNILVDFYAALAGLEGYVTRWVSTGDMNLDNGVPGTGTINAAPDVMQFMSDISNNTAKISRALTNYIQQNGDGFVNGQAYISTPFVEVRWAWLVYPLVLVLAGTIALMATIWQTRKKKLALWKASPFPLLFNYHDTSACAADGDGQGNAYMPQAVKSSRHGEMAEETKLRLRVKDEVWVFQKEE